MSAYGWIITEDHLFLKTQHHENNIFRDETGVTGPRSIAPDIEAALEIKDEEERKLAFKKQGRDLVKFQMHDADGELYYTGWLAGDYGGAEPLDDFGLPNAGAIYIRWFEDGKWTSSGEPNI